MDTRQKRQGEERLDSDEGKRARTTEEAQGTSATCNELLYNVDSLIELHTHLLGMGSHVFWMNNLMLDRDKMPTRMTESDSASSNAQSASFWKVATPLGGWL